MFVSEVTELGVVGPLDALKASINRVCMLFSSTYSVHSKSPSRFSSKWIATEVYFSEIGQARSIYSSGAVTLI